MSDFNKVISDLVTHDEIRKSFLKKPDQLLKNYDLTEKDVAQLKSINIEEISVIDQELEERMSKTFVDTVHFWNLDAEENNGDHSSHSDYAVPHDSSW